MPIHKVLVLDDDEQVNRVIEREAKAGLVCIGVVPATVSGRRDTRERELQLVCTFERSGGAAPAAAASVPTRPLVPKTLRDLRIDDSLLPVPQINPVSAGAYRESAVASRAA